MKIRRPDDIWQQLPSYPASHCNYADGFMCCGPFRTADNTNNTFIIFLESRGVMRCLEFVVCMSYYICVSVRNIYQTVVD